MATMQEIKIHAAIEALLNNGLNQSKTAKELGISRGALRSYLSEFTGSTKNLGADVLKAYGRMV